jgi:hypothetical protein
VGQAAVDLGVLVVSPQEIAARVAASCAASGVPVHIEDPGTLRRLADLLSGGAERGPRARPKGERGPRRLTTTAAT